MELSIVIPLYNTAVEEFKKCVESVYMLEGISFELIVINDGSNEYFSKDYEHILSQYTNVNYIKVANSGVSNARNLGIQEAKGEYIFFVDSDDTIDSEKINNEVLSSHLFGKYDLICGDAFYSKGENLKLKEELTFKKKGEFSYKEVLEDMVLNNSFLMPVAKFIRKSFISEHNLLFNTDFIQGEDALFNMILLDCKPTIYYLNEPIYYYFYTPDNYEKRCEKNFSKVLENFLEKYKVEKRIIYSNSLQSSLEKVVAEKTVRHIFRMALVSQRFDEKSSNDFSNYLKLFKLDKSSLSFKCLMEYKLLENNKNNSIFKILSELRQWYIRIRY